MMSSILLVFQLSMLQALALAGSQFPVHIGAEGHIVQGRISADAPPGSLIPSNVIVEGENDADTRIHLRVEIRDSTYTRPHVYHPDIKINTSDPANPQFQHPVIEFVNGTLPYGMEFVVIHTNAFYVNEDRYICVNDFSSLGGETRVHFDETNQTTRIVFEVILKDKLAETIYVSNQLPFVVEVEYPVRESHPKAALFAGVLVLIILAVSLLIPFVVRSKRRWKAGKPICGCGSAEEGCDNESSAEHSTKSDHSVDYVPEPIGQKMFLEKLQAFDPPSRPEGSDMSALRQCLSNATLVKVAKPRGIMPELDKQKMMNISGKENLAMILDNGRILQHSSSLNQNMTLQNRMLRSTSSMMFQPHWMDPHYNAVYDRPDFQRVLAAQNQQMYAPGSPQDSEPPSTANSTAYLFPPHLLQRGVPLPAGENNATAAPVDPGYATIRAANGDVRNTPAPTGGENAGVAAAHETIPKSAETSDISDEKL